MASTSAETFEPPWGSGGDDVTSSAILFPPSEDADGSYTTALLLQNLTTTLAPNMSTVAASPIELHLRHSLPVTIFLALIAGIIAIATICGNLLVLVAFFLDRNLRQPGNYLIVSLALADLLIGIFSMPLYTLYLLLDELWPLGWIACDLWLSLDYTVRNTTFCFYQNKFLPPF